MSYVLIVDDSALARMIVRRSLSAAGFASDLFREAPDGQAALDAIRAEPPKLVVADVNMPRMTGEEMLAAIRLEPALHGVPVVMCSSAVNEAMATRLRSLGARAVIRKPFAPQELQSALALAMRGDA
jgi:two-component system chemotaxis response regulator CheY